MLINKAQEEASDNASRMTNSLGTTSLVSILKRQQNTAKNDRSHALVLEEVTVDSVTSCKITQSSGADAILSVCELEIQEDASQKEDAD